MKTLLPTAAILWALVSIGWAQEGAAAEFRVVATQLRVAADAYTSGKAEDFEQALRLADEGFGRAQSSLRGANDEPHLRIHARRPRGKSEVVPKSLRSAADQFEVVARSLESGTTDAAAKKIQSDALKAGFEAAEKAINQDAIITDDPLILAILLAIAAALFGLAKRPAVARLFKIVPLLVFAYFVPTLLSNLGVIPIDAPVYAFIRRYLLPLSLALMCLAVDLPAIAKLGKQALVMFLTATVTVVIGGPLAFLLCKGLLPESFHDQAWRGLAALCGSWIGGGTNFIAMGEAYDVSASTLGMMVVVDIAVAELWTVALFVFAGREAAMDAKIGAKREAILEVRAKMDAWQASQSRVASVGDLLMLLAVGFGITAISLYLTPLLPKVGEVLQGFVWTVVLVTTFALAASFTPLRNLEGVGASKLGTALLYLLVGSIGASAQLAHIFDLPGLFVIAAVWMIFHAVGMFVVRRLIKAPIFFLAVGSKANIGGAASAPIVASAFHPSLAPVAVLLAIFGYVLGTYGGVICATMLKWIAS
jgi:uncharacterized membrane protein